MLKVGLIQQHLSGGTVGRDIRLHGTVTSTNEVLKELARAGSPEGTVVIADEQTAGHGRLKKSWFSPPGVNFYASVLFRPPIPLREVPGFSFITSLAAADAIALEGLRPAIKWPNDVLVDKKKVAGSLAECASSGRKVDFVILGVGVNVNVAPAALRAALGDAARAAGSLGEAAGREIDRNVFAANFLNLLDKWASVFAAQGLAPILERSLEGHRPTTPEVESLFRARGDQVDAISFVADQLRERAVGDTVTYVVNRNINYTNLCYFKCGFCAFSKGPKSLNLRGEPYLMGIEEIVGNAREASARGATEVTLQGGIHPDFTGNFYVDVVRAIKAELPDMHIHGFTPLEVWQGAHTLGIPVRRFLEELQEAGLGTLPGTAAEILDDEVRAHLCPDKIRTSQWAEVMITAHELGLRATSTIMFGHIDHPRSWANHLEVIARIQQRTGGFTEMVPLPFVHMGSPIFLRGRARPGPTWDEVVLIHAVARIALDGLVPNIQASWVKLGLDGGRRLLDAGCNDLGGTLMGEIITRSAGAAHGQEVTPQQFREVIEAAGRTPALRSTVYEILDRV